MEDNIEKSSLDVDFLDEIKFPHKIGFEKNLKKNNNNSFNASIHCLTNIVPSSQYISNSNDFDHPYSELVVKLNGNNQKGIKDCIIKLKNYIMEYNYFPESNQDPKLLIDFILNDLQKNKYLFPGFLTNFQKKCKTCSITSDFEELKIIKFDIPQIIENINKNNKNKKITIYDCFDYFFQTLNDEKKFCNKCKRRNTEISINKLPSILIIFIDYGKDKNICYNNSYEFEESIAFKNFNCLKEDDKNREYFLSSIIAGKSIDTYFELFYTFARADEDSNYIIYNGNDVRENLMVTNKLKKEKIDFTNKKESWPFVLVYIDKKEKNYENKEII